MKTLAGVAENYGLEETELAEFADFMDVNSETEGYLLYIVAESMTQPLPVDWAEVEDESSGRTYYYNQNTNETSWEHPLDQYYKNLIFIERKNGGLQGEDVEDVEDEEEEEEEEEEDEEDDEEE